MREWIRSFRAPKMTQNAVVAMPVKPSVPVPTWLVAWFKSESLQQNQLAKASLDSLLAAVPSTDALPWLTLAESHLLPPVNQGKSSQPSRYLLMLQAFAYALEQAHTEGFQSKQRYINPLTLDQTPVQHQKKGKISLDGLGWMIVASHIPDEGSALLQRAMATGLLPNSPATPVKTLPKKITEVADGSQSNNVLTDSTETQAVADLNAKRRAIRPTPSLSATDEARLVLRQKASQSKIHPLKTHVIEVLIELLSDINTHNVLPGRSWVTPEGIFIVSSAFRESLTASLPTHLRHITLLKKHDLYLKLAELDLIAFNNSNPHWQLVAHVGKRWQPVVALKVKQKLLWRKPAHESWLFEGKIGSRDKISENLLNDNIVEFPNMAGTLSN